MQKGCISFYFILSRLISYSWSCRKLLSIAIVMLWLVAGIEIIGPIIIGHFINYILSVHVFSIQVIINLSTVLLILYVLVAILRYYQSLLFNSVALKIVGKIRVEAMYSVLHQPLHVFDHYSIGQFISRVTNDTEVIKDLYVTVIASILRNITMISTVLIAMFFLDWRLACIALTIFPAVIGIILIYQHYSIPIMKNIRNYISDISDIFNEIINGMETIQHFQQQNRFRDKINNIGHAYLRTRMKNLRLEGYFLRPFINLLFSSILCGILLFFGLCQFCSIKAGILYTFIAYLGRLNEPIIELISQQSIIQQAIITGERVFRLIDNPLQQYGTDDFPLKHGTVELKELQFSYNFGLPVLRNISLTIHEKNFVALVGRSGSGKSTLANLLVKHYSIDSGLILLDDRPIETLSHQVLRKSVTLIQQDPAILNDTVYNNITLGKKVNEKEVWHALENVNLAKLISTFPKGLSTKLGENGNILSVGQRQLISIARILISKPVILVLDEPTARVDSDIEKLVLYTLKILKKYMTLIVITHRLSTIIDADEIFVLHNGEIVEKGNHISLLEMKGRYYKMYQLYNQKKILLI